MIKKMFLFFCCFYIFALSPGFADNDRIFINPKVADLVIRKYFGKLVSDKKIIQNNTIFLTDEIILNRVLRTWRDCIKSDADNLVSIQCVTEVCKVAFGHAMYAESEYSFVKSETNEYCKRFSFDLVNNNIDDEITDCMYTINKKNGSQMNILYKAFDNTGFVRVGGSIAWRLFNPGNLRRSSLACTRIDTKPNGAFAAFESYEKGRQALKILLRGDVYGDLNIAQAISKYAPAHENNTAGYIRNVKNSLRTLRSDVDTVKLRDLSDSQLDFLIDTIQQLEGWNVTGTVSLI